MSIVRSTRTIFVSHGFVRVEEKAIKIAVLQFGATFSREDEPHESVTRATLSSMVQPYFVHGTAVLSNEGTAVFENLTVFCLKNKAVLRVNYGDSRTIEL